ncbi:MAG: hypothetical protein JETT_2121 [Candidatus Jettenia ecosi]|uniref:Uncharacterized protein n=1 Tax=Candidatus Jettenia ecosi TaxID=2494326 RepID=A0A533QAA4_9BACT|nr:MAG: hypothetical protein JETT_2121 [Candidatus Jettenia ecosi]
MICGINPIDEQIAAITPIKNHIISIPPCKYLTLSGRFY